MKCLSCNHSVLKKYLTITNAPTQVEVIQKVNLSQDKKIPLVLYQCQRCTLVQLSKDNRVTSIEKDYYDDYLMSRTYSSLVPKYQKALARDFIGQFDLVDKRIVDVGCGDGYFVHCLNREGAKAIGIEPSQTAVRLARERGVKVIQAYIDRSFHLPGDKADAFVSCQVFEHVANPGEILTYIKKFLYPVSYGLIEVPSFIKALRDDRYYDFFPDHVAYYSPASLSYLLEQNGFQVLSVNHTANDEYITAYVRYDMKKSMTRDVQVEFTHYKNTLKAFFQRYKGKEIALWGAGAKGAASTSFAGIDCHDVAYCVDSDPNKLGHFMAGSHIPVMSPAQLLKQRPDIVIITALMYKDEIIETLKKKYKFRTSQIGVIGPTPSILEA